jgi:hypothetical protein
MNGWRVHDKVEARRSLDFGAYGLCTQREPDCASELAIWTHIPTIEVTVRLHRLNVDSMEQRSISLERSVPGSLKRVIMNERKVAFCP